jgi:hypothetical protein
MDIDEKNAEDEEMLDSEDDSDEMLLEEGVIEMMHDDEEIGEARERESDDAGKRDDGGEDGQYQGEEEIENDGGEIDDTGTPTSRANGTL